MKKQKGVAIVTALLLATLAVTLVTGLFWQQQVEIRAVENQRLHAQIEWLHRAALDWAGVSLNIPGRSNLTADHLGQAWAKPVPDLKLDEYTGESNAKMSRQIIDAQSRFNLANLVREDARDPIAYATFRRLLVILNLPPTLADPITQAFLPKVMGAREIDLMYPEDLLAIPGVTPEILKRLAPFIVILPTADTAINLNTAPAEVFAACYEDISQSEAITLVNERTRAYFRDAGDIRNRVKAHASVDSERNHPVSFSSNYFLVHHRIQLDRASRKTLALLRREGNSFTVVWTRPEPVY